MLAAGTSLREVFVEAARGLVEIMGVGTGEGEESTEISLEAPDLEALMVDWLNEIIWVQESKDALIADIEVRTISSEGLVGALTSGPRGQGQGGTAVKAATFHRLYVKEQAQGWEALVYLDV